MPSNKPKRNNSKSTPAQQSSDDSQSRERRRFHQSTKQSNRKIARNEYSASVLYQAMQQCGDTGSILTPRQLECIKTHKYNAEGTSLIEPFFQPFWKWLVEFVPVSVAPNYLTLIGLLCNIFPTAALCLLSDGAKQQCPRVCYLMAGLGLFTYQALDAIDGKQARRTGSSSPLGELFDHGCDALSSVLIGLHVLVLFQAGREPNLMFIVFLSILLAYYCAHWQTYVTGKLRFGFIEVTESQLAVIIIDLVCFAFQNEFWNYTVGSSVDVQITLRFICLTFTLLGCLRSALDNINTISNGGVGIHGSSVANSSIVSPLFQYLLIVVMAYTINQKSNSRLFDNYPILYLLTFGLAWCKYTDILIVATMSRSRIFTIDTALIGPCLLLLNQYLGFILPEYIVLYFACSFCAIDLARYCIRICNEISTFLGIKVFSIS